jgi:cytochrome c-type biogenesis protein CcmH
MKRQLQRYAWPVLIAVLLIAFGVGTFTDAHTAPPTAQQRVDRLASEIRCPTCEGLSVQQSVAPLAESAKQQISTEVAAGQSDQQIKAYFVSRYGSNALMSPKRQGVNWAVWLVPAAAALALIGGVVFAVRRWRIGTGASHTRPTDEQRRRVTVALEHTPSGAKP